MIIRQHPGVYKGKGRTILLGRAQEQEEWEEQGGGPEGASVDGVEVATDRAKKKGAKVKVVLRPQIYDLDEGVLHLYNLVMRSLVAKGFRDYAPTLGEWVREVVFQFHLDHPEIVDLRTLFTEEEKRQLQAQVLVAGGGKVK